MTRQQARVEVEILAAKRLSKLHADEVGPPEACGHVARWVGEEWNQNLRALLLEGQDPQVFHSRATRMIDAYVRHVHRQRHNNKLLDLRELA